VSGADDNEGRLGLPFILLLYAIPVPQKAVF